MADSNAPPKSYHEWEVQVPACIKDDPLWTMQVYRLALFAADLAWQDCLKLRVHPVARGLADQLYRAVGSIGANLAEGYGRSGNRDRAHFFEFALGSARECRHWYYQGRECLGERVTEHRLDLLTQVTRHLVGTVRHARADRVREEIAGYDTGESREIDWVTGGLVDRER